MRVITGIAKGARLDSVKGNSVRPTTDKIKEAIFSTLQFEIESRDFLDLFAGSGQMGIEALSRGARKVTFVDSSIESIKVIKHNLNKTGLISNAEIVHRDALSFLKTTACKLENYKKGSDADAEASPFHGPAACGLGGAACAGFDIVYLDPPYKSVLMGELMERLPCLMKKTGIAVYECRSNYILSQKFGDFILDRVYHYGKIDIRIYCLL